MVRRSELNMYMESRNAFEILKCCAPVHLRGMETLYCLRYMCSDVKFCKSVDYEIKRHMNAI